jgi:hypothetical protein
VLILVACLAVFSSPTIVLNFFPENASWAKNPAILATAHDATLLLSMLSIFTNNFLYSWYLADFRRAVRSFFCWQRNSVHPLSSGASHSRDNVTGKTTRVTKIGTLKIEEPMKDAAPKGSSRAALRQY